MGQAEAPVQSAPAETPQQQSVVDGPASPTQTNAATVEASLSAKIAALEAKIAKIETEAIKEVHQRIGAVETFLKGKYPYSL